MSENQLFDPSGNRLYLTADERTAFLNAAANAPRKVRTLCATLHFTGCRISEALALTSRRVDFSGQTVIFETLKKRKTGIYRAVPVPAEFLDTLDMVHGLHEQLKRSGDGRQDVRLWSWTRVHGWRVIKAVMNDAGIDTALPHATAKGLRHGYGVAAISAAVPLNMLSKWMGHASIETTAIYANVIGAEQQAIAARMWE